MVNNAIAVLKGPRPPSFPKWLSVITSTDPVLVNNYLPQEKDHVFYFRQGHTWNTVESLGPFSESEYKFPWHKVPALRWKEKCVVQNLQYVFNPPYPLHFLLTLELQNPPESEKTRHFSVLYRPCSDQPDFIMLQSKYEATAKHGPYLVGEFVYGCFSQSSDIDSYHTATGHVIQRGPRDISFPESDWESTTVLWEDGDSFRVSPWEVARTAEFRAAQETMDPQQVAECIKEVEQLANRNDCLETKANFPLTCSLILDRLRGGQYYRSKESAITDIAFSRRMVARLSSTDQKAEPSSQPV